MTPHIDLSNIGEPAFKWPAILQHPTIPRAMWGLNPRTVLGQEWWDVQRKAAYAKNNYCCWACGAPRTHTRLLEAHECYLIDYVEGTMELRLVVALDTLCHEFIHFGYTTATKSPLHAARVWARGTKTLGLWPTFPPELAFLEETLKSLSLITSGKKTAAPSEKWRLLLDGKEYKPDPSDFIHESYNE